MIDNETHKWINPATKKEVSFSQFLSLRSRWISIRAEELEEQAETVFAHLTFNESPWDQAEREADFFRLPDGFELRDGRELVEDTTCLEQDPSAFQ